MAPMIDMVFLLLVFFMCVSTMADAEKALPLDLPESTQAKVPDDLSDRGTLSIDAEGAVFLGERPVDLDAIKEAIAALVQRNPGTRVVVRADRTTAFQSIREVLQVCAEAGAYEIVYATHEAN